MKILFYLLINSIILGSNIIIKVETKKNEYIYYEDISIEYKIINNSDKNYFYPDARAYIIDEEGKEEIFGSYLKRLRRMPLFIKGREIKNGGIGGIMTKSGRYRIYVMINGEKAKDDNSYLKFKEKFKDQNFDILTEKIKSNEVEIEVKEPEGIDKEVYERYLKVDEMRWKAYDSENPIFWELLEKYPSSSYAEWLLCKGDISSSKEYIKNHYFQDEIGIYVNKKPWENQHPKAVESRKETKRHIEAIMKVMENHKNSKCYSYYLLDGIKSYLTLGEFEKVCIILKALDSLEPKDEIESIIKEKAKRYINALNKYYYCR